MSVVDDMRTSTATPEDLQHLDALFSHLELQHVETFYKQYQHWQLTQQMVELQTQLVAIEQKSVDNMILMQLTQPSPIALAALTRLQSYGVDDVDLLDNMLEQGDTWLDHTLQLLEQCQSLGFIRDNYTEWCQHALEGAYDWLDSIGDTEVAQPAVQPSDEQVVQTPINENETEIFIQRLMSEEDTLEIPAIVGTNLSRPFLANDTVKEHDEAILTDESVPTPPIPSVLSYSMKAKIALEETTLHEEIIPVPMQPIREIPVADKRQRYQKRGLVSRILSKVWRT